jgi:hypothetical protein
MIDIFEAVKRRWDEKDLPATITGGIFAEGEAPAKRSYPYAIATTISQTPAGWTNTKRFRQQLFQIRIFDVQRSLVVAHAERIETALGFAPLDLDGADADMMEIRPGQVTIMQEDKQVFKAVIEFTARWQQPVNYRPQ